MGGKTPPLQIVCSTHLKNQKSWKVEKENKPVIRNLQLNDADD